MSRFELKAEIRDFSGKEKAKKLRAQGKFPAIVYGAEEEPVSLTLPIREMTVLLGRIHGEKVLVDLKYGDKEDKVFVRNIQRDPASEKLLHADFYRVDPNHAIDTKVPVTHVGLPAGVRTGGLLEHGMRELEIHCLPTQVPPHIEVDVENLEIGDAIHVRDLPPIEGVRFITHDDAVIYSVIGRKAEEPVAGAPEEEGEGELAEGEEAPATASQETS